VYEANSHKLGGGHVCWGSYDGFTFAGGVAAVELVDNDS